MGFALTVLPEDPTNFRVSLMNFRWYFYYTHPFIHNNNIYMKAQKIRYMRGRSPAYHISFLRGVFFSNGVLCTFSYRRKTHMKKPPRMRLQGGQSLMGEGTPRIIKPLAIDVRKFLHITFCTWIIWNQDATFLSPSSKHACLFNMITDIDVVCLLTSISQSTEDLFSDN